MNNTNHISVVTKSASGVIRTPSITPFSFIIVACAALVFLTASRPSLAVTFSDAINAQLAFDPNNLGENGNPLACARLVGGSPRDEDPNSDHIDEPLDFGSELALICGELAVTPPADATNSTGGAGASPVSGLVSNRLRAFREEECQEGEKQCKEKGAGASADAETDLGSGLSVFVSANYQDLDRDTTDFEDGYDSDLWGVTIGTEYVISDTLAAGLALNYTHWDGNFDSGGRFDKNSYGPIVYASFFPREGVFADLVLGYNRIDVSSKRRRTYTAEDGALFGGNVEGDPDDNEFSTSLLVGIDYPIRQFTVGPRLGLDFGYTDLDGYSESGTTGLELNFEADSETSLQSRLGLQGSMAISTTFAVLVPQVRGDWVHEFADDQRSISARFVQDLRDNPTSFGFENEEPDRDFFEINAGIVAVFPHDIQVFVNYWTLQGDKYLDSHAGSVGMRVDF